MSTYNTITVDVDNGVGVVTLNRPDVMNAINIEMTGELDDALWTLEKDESVRVIVLTGAGKAFSSGFDVSSGADAFGDAAHEEHNEELDTTDADLTSRYAFWTMRTPMIAAINGAAIGAGFTITLLADIRVVAADAKLRLPFVRMNLIPDASSTWLLTRMVGVSRAMELMLTGRFFSGQEAADIGLASRAVPRDEVLSSALELAREIADHTAPMAVGVTKQLMYRALETGDRSAIMTEETRLTWWAGTQPDTVVGVTAMLSRQPGEWQQSKHTPLPEDLA